MGLITLFVLLGVFAWLAVVADRRIQARKQADLAAAQSTTETKLARNWRAPWRRPRPIEKTQTFRAWAVTSFADQPALQHWLAALSDEAIQLLTAKLTDFCTDLGFEFDWLLDHKVDQEGTLAPRLQSIALQYIAACYQALLVQEDVKVFQTWLDFTEQPYRKEQQALAQYLLAKLLAQGLTPPAVQNLLTAPEKEREIYVVQAVREAAQKHPAAFRAVLKNVLNIAVDTPSATEPIANQREPVRRYPADETPPMVTEQPIAAAV